MTVPEGFTYQQAGVDTERKAQAMARLLPWLEGTFSLPGELGSPILPLGYFANVVRVSPDLGIAITTDNVGTKLLVAQMVGRYDTVGQDCVVINANDLLCVGATPLAMVDYMAVAKVDPAVVEQIGRGLAEGARQAQMAIVGGETAQVGEMLRGVHPESALDLAGTAIGLVHPDRLIVGADLEPGDAVIGLASSGLHCNGLTLARRVLLQEAGLDLEAWNQELGQTLSEAMLEPTRCYVAFVRSLLVAEVPVRALIHVSGDGLFNLTRVKRPDVGYHLTELPETPSIFRLIQLHGRVEEGEMYRVFNMGIGFCVVLPEAATPRVLAAAQAHGIPAWRLGTVTHDPQRRVILEPVGLVGRDGRFVPGMP